MRSDDLPHRMFLSEIRLADEGASSFIDDVEFRAFLAVVPNCYPHPGAHNARSLAPNQLPSCPDVIWQHHFP
jgi:hypothetical protein